MSDLENRFNAPKAAPPKENPLIQQSEEITRSVQQEMKNEALRLENLAHEEAARSDYVAVAIGEEALKQVNSRENLSTPTAKDDKRAADRMAKLDAMVKKTAAEGQAVSMSTLPDLSYDQMRKSDNLGILPEPPRKRWWQFWR
jgi:hypothetical protein